LTNTSALDVLVDGWQLKLTSQRISLPAGPWEVVTPESMGLSTAALQKAETDTSKAAGSRYCYLVVKKVRAWVLVT